MMQTTVALFWASVTLILYVFAGYPLLLCILARLRPRLWKREAHEPLVSIIVAAHNEAGTIVQKIENLLSLDYPADRLEILVGSDGSTDATPERLLHHAQARVRPFIFHNRRGKPAVLNDLVPRAGGEIIVFADVRQTFDGRALRALTRSFADPNVGAVTGELMLRREGPEAAVGEGSGFYWRYEKAIRSWESLVHSTIVVTGAIYAIRKALFQQIGEATITDDLLVPLQIIRRGYRVVFEREALAYDAAPDTTTQELTRKTRTLAGAFQLFARERWLLSPLRNPVWWQTMSHKLLRLAVAPLQVAAFGTNVILAGTSSFYSALLFAQLCFYAGAIAGWIVPRHWKCPRALAFPYIFCLLSWASVLGFARWVSGRQTVLWDKAARPAANVMLAVFLLFAVACGGGTAATIDLPHPSADDRPPGSAAELPRLTVDLPPEDSPQGGMRALSQGDDLQLALDGAQPGDVIVLEPRAVFRGPFTLRAKEGTGWITIRTGAAQFPPRGTRVTPAHAAQMPVIETDGPPAIRSEAGAHHYRFVGIEVRPETGAFAYSLIDIGAETSNVNDVPHHIVFERCYVHGDRREGARRGLALNSSHSAVFDSWIADFKEEGADSQAIAGWNGPGPFAIVNNYLEAAGENVMFGGADPTIRNLVPSDIEIRGNHLHKPLSWRGEAWTVKNLFELKNARRVLIELNVFENNWEAGQNGYAILFTPRNQDGGSPWSMVRDVTFRRNVVRHAGGGVNISGRDDLHPSEQTKRIVIVDNLFDDIVEEKWGGSGRLFQLTDGAADVIIEHNTGLQSGEVLVASGPANPGFMFRNNLVLHNANGIAGDNYYGNPAMAISTYFPASQIEANVLQGGSASDYPPGNFFPASIAEIGFIDYDGRNYRLGAGSPFRNAATDGKDVGADLDGLAAPRARRRAAAH